MKEGPDIALVASLIGDPARANILTALMSGKALTVSELAGEAGITLQTASSHLKKLEDVRLVQQRKQGRHRYFALAGEDIADLLEMLMGFAARRGLLRTRTGPGDADLRKARICYDHLAGELGVMLFDGSVARGYICETGDEVELTSSGSEFFAGLGIDGVQLKASRRPVCKSCLDWSERRMHLAGQLGAAILDYFLQCGWARREENSRVISFTHAGEMNFRRMFE
jgi:DNA-binding transcriptional ArsR family regulator